MAKHNPAETLRQKIAFADEARYLGAEGNRSRLDLDLGYRRHAERVAELIGESATRLPAELRSKWDDVPWKKMISMRNWLIHFYDGIDTDIRWDVLNTKAAELATSLTVILKTMDDVS